MQRYPDNINVDIEDFRRSDWKSSISTHDREGYSGMWQSLSAAARAAIENGKSSEGKTLWLLADACSMMLSPRSVNEPFQPFIVMDGKRSSLPEDFQQPDVVLFSQIAEEVDNVWLKARLSDLVWLLQRPRNPRFAILAIDSYREVPLDTETWIRGGRECWERAIRLALMLGAGAGDRLRQIETKLISTIDLSTHDDGFLALWLGDMLIENHLGHDKRSGIAAKLETLAKHFEAHGDLHRCREYFDASAKWFQKAGDETKSTEMTVFVAETWVKEGIARMSSEQPSHMVGASFIENAIQKYRTIPKGRRADYRVDERILELNAQMSIAGKKSLDEMSVIESPPIDISELVENARNAVRGKSAIDALSAFANIYGGARVTKIREFSEKILREHPLQALFSATHMSRDGRVIARRPGMNLGDTASDENEAVVWAEMVRHYCMELGLVVQGDILPSLEILHLEHGIREADFVGVCSHSPIVPHGREQLFGKGLFAGYEKDFASALHLLVPQIEHAVRWHLKSRGVKTTNLDNNGIENENGLSALMELPEIKQVFGEDLAFELKALFCDAFGPNLRNEIAHGLLDYESCASVYSIYAWWLSLKIVFNTFWNTRKKVDETTDASINA
jgi:hypothetical protein